MCVGNEGQREPRVRSWCSTSSTRVVIVTPGVTRGAIASIAPRRCRQACAISSSSRSRLDAAELVHERRALDSARRPGSDLAQLDHRLRPDRCPSAMPPRRPEAADGLGERGPAVAVLLDHDARRAAAPRRDGSRRPSAAGRRRGSRPGARKAPATQPCAYEMLPKLGRSRSIPVRYSRSDDGATKSASIPCSSSECAEPVAPRRILLLRNRHDRGGSHAWSSSTPATGSPTSTARSPSTPRSASRSGGGCRSARRRSTSSWGCRERATSWS